MKVFKCPYCGLDTTGSEEHVIPHALGGSLKSEWVCCNGCNNQLGKIVDAPFIKMFAPLCAKMKPLNGMHEFVGAYGTHQKDVCEYTQRKFARLWNYLISQKR